MEVKAFTVIFKKKNQVLYLFFRKRLLANPHFYGNLHQTIGELRHLTYEAAYLKVLEGGLSRLSVERIIMKKAMDVYCEVFRIPKRSLPVTGISPEHFDVSSGEPDPCQLMVLQEDVTTVEGLMTECERSLMENLIDEVDRKVMQADWNVKESALNMRIMRLRERLQEHLTKGY